MKWFRLLAPGMVALLALALLPTLPVLVAALSPRGSTTLLSVTLDGSPGDGSSSGATLSADGRYVAFQSRSSLLVPSDTNGYMDIFVLDRQTGKTTRISVGPEGEEGNLGSFTPALSADGRVVAFLSLASNLVAGDTNSRQDIFVYDRQSGEMERVSGGRENRGGADWGRPALSATGRFVAFVSPEDDLITGDTNNRNDVFVYDRQTGQTSRVSVASDGSESDGTIVGQSSLSADGRYVAFASVASSLVPSDTNQVGDVFVHDRQTGQTSRVSVASDGSDGGHFLWSGNPAISGDGRFVAFDSIATMLVPSDTNGVQDGFVHDRQTGETRRVSVASDGTQADAPVEQLAISPDGRFVTFTSGATTLVPGDGNGYRDIFVHDRQSGETQLVSFAPNGQLGAGPAVEPALSADGQLLAFTAEAGFYSCEPDGLYNTDIYLHDLTVPPVGGLVALDHLIGAPGSYLTLSGSGFAPGSPLELLVNRQGLGTVGTDAQGAFTAVLATTGAGPGDYAVTVRQAAGTQPERSASFTLDPDAALHPDPGGGDPIAVPAGIALVERLHLPLFPGCTVPLMP